MTNVFVSAYSKTWPCLIPQHGPGQKHHRPIVLEPWQEQLVERVRQIFVEACTTLGLHCTHAPHTVYVSRKADVAILDRHVGRKT